MFAAVFFAGVGAGEVGVALLDEGVLITVAELALKRGHGGILGGGGAGSFFFDGAFVGVAVGVVGWVGHR